MDDIIDQISESKDDQSLNDDSLLDNSFVVINPTTNQDNIIKHSIGPDDNELRDGEATIIKEKSNTPKISTHKSPIKSPRKSPRRDVKNLNDDEPDIKINGIQHNKKSLSPT